MYIILKLTKASAAVVQARVEQKCVSNFTIGAMGNIEGICGTYIL